ncbi:DarT ssDNA thymidine ADP-ribosyltransferase family protein [Parafrankia sp. FMc6]|uniref:DarT ssDNA thymidine ADP-ribosyltransferase family protein n=1 Tax=Parafrankia soli TaxID=2599596 RepID=UPI0034D7457C
MTQTMPAHDEPPQEKSGIVAEARKLGITELLHFTTKFGLVGVLGSSCVKSRRRLPQDAYVEFVYTPNCSKRYETDEWLDYVNLSISRINDWMLNCSMRWHRGEEAGFWCVLAFNVEIIGDPGVYITTTNNCYPSVLRQPGFSGLREAFAETVAGRYGNLIARSADHNQNWPTDRQAEVLYPGELYLDRLDSIYVSCDEDADEVHAIWAGATPGWTTAPVKVAPEVFQ